MPYIKQDKRDMLDGTIEQLHQALVEMEIDDEMNNMEGNINYAITRLLMMVYGDRETTNYAQINDAIGALECIKQEFYRKVAAPYEDQKSFENGDVARFREHEPEVVGEVEIVVPMDLIDD
jgi:hypothetical protein